MHSKILFLIILSLSLTDWCKYAVFVLIAYYFIIAILNFKIVRNVSRNISKNSDVNILIKPLIYIITTAIISGVLVFNKWSYFRDILYFIYAPLCIWFGFILRDKIHHRKLLDLILMICGGNILFLFTIIILKSTSIFSVGFEDSIELGYASVNNIVLFAILTLSNWKASKFQSLVVFSVQIITFCIIILSFSRTQYILLLAIFIIRYILPISFKRLFIICSLILIAFLVISPSSSGIFSESQFANKSMNSLDEIVFSDFDNTKDITNNWRGYEAFLGFESYSNGSVFQLVFGKGFGSYVFTPYWVFEGEVPELDIIPIFHNSFITILLKSGIFGIVMYLIFLLRILKVSFQPKHELIININWKVNLFIFIYIILISLVAHGIQALSISFLALFILGYNYSNNENHLSQT